MRNRLWSYAAYNYFAVDMGTHVIADLHGAAGAPEVGDVIPATYRASRFAGKLTWRTSASSTLALSVFGDPGRYEGKVAYVAGPPQSYLGTQTDGGTNATLRYQATFGSSFIVQATAGSHHESFVYGGAGVDIPSSYDFTVTPGLSSGGIGWYTNSWQTRRVVRLDLSKAVGRHELKLGGDLEPLQTEEDFTLSGGAGVAKVAQDDLAFYNHFLYIDTHAPGFDRDDPATWQPSPALHVDPHTRNVSAHMQDSWRIGRGVVLNLGLRFERQRLPNYHRNRRSASTTGRRA